MGHIWSWTGKSFTLCNGLSLILTFKDLQRLIQEREQNHGSSNNSEFSFLKGRPFWYWDLTRHKEKGKSQKGNCCFNHIIGLPKKDNKCLPMFDYEMLLYKSLIEPGYLNNNPSGT